MIPAAEYKKAKEVARIKGAYTLVLNNYKKRGSLLVPAMLRKYWNQQVDAAWKMGDDAQAVEFLCAQL